MELDHKSYNVDGRAIDSVGLTGCAQKKIKMTEQKKEEIDPVTGLPIVVTPEGDLNKEDENLSPEQIKAKEVQALADAQLAEIKKKLDAAYAARDEALNLIAAADQKRRQEEITALEKAGQHKEAFDLKEAQFQARIVALEKANTELTRDATLRTVLSSYDLRSDNARDMAYRSIVDQLVKDSHGNWVHKSGVSIKDFVEVYAKDEDNAFLFKVKASSGAGAGPVNGAKPVDSNKNTSLFGRPLTDVLAMAEKGQLPHQLKRVN
jgi:hypothetical protein